MEPQSFYDPSDAKRKTIDHVIDRKSKMEYQRNKKHNYFNDRSLLPYIDDSVKRWNGYIPPRDDLTMDWQSRVFQNFTRNVVIGFLSKAALNRPKSRFVATNKEGYEDVQRAHVLSKINEYTRNKENGDWKFLMSALECVTKGTVVVYEGFKKTKRKVKEVISFDPITGAVKYEEKTILDYNDCFQQIVPLEEFYIGNVWEPDLHNQPDVIWKQIIKKAEAQEEFAKYPDWKYVVPGAFTSVDENQSFFRNKVSSDLEVDQVEVIRYYNRMKDQYSILANGILLYDGPIPFTHKDYPFAKTVYEPFAVDFFYGKSLPNKIETDQDIINTLWNMGLDQNFLSIHKPILTDDDDESEETILVPGLIKKVTDINKYRVMSELTGPDRSYFEMLNFAFKTAQDNSGNVIGGGQAYNPKGGTVTARQAMMQQEQAQQVMGLSAKYLEKLEHDATILRCKNILQFYTIPEKNEAITGTPDAMGGFHRTIRVDDTELSDGTYGSTVIKMGDEQPTSEELSIQEEMAKMQGQNVEIFSITPDYIRNIDFDVQVINESSFMQSKSLEQAMGTEFYQMAIANPLINQEENTRDWVKMYDKDPDKFIKQMTPNPENPMAMAGAGATPETSANVLGKGKAGELGSMGPLS